MPRRQQLVFLIWFLAVISIVGLFETGLKPHLQRAWFHLLGDAGDKAVAGRDGWLFYRPDVRYLVEPPGAAEDPVAAIAGFRDQLRQRGIELIVVPIPGKPVVHPDKLTRRASAPVRSPTLATMARLRAAGVEVVDLFELISRGSYLARDTHWSPQAAQLAAVAVARRIRALGWIDMGEMDYAVRDVRLARPSDIPRMIGLADTEEVLCQQVVHAGQPYRDDPHSPVLVLGDSFLRIYQTDAPRSAGFIAHLARELRRPVASIVNDGGASTLVRQQLSRRAGLLHGKRVVVWEFVERDLRFGAEGWKKVPLPPTPAPSRNP